MQYWKRLLNEKTFYKEKRAFIALFVGILITIAIHIFSQKNIASVFEANDKLENQYAILSSFEYVEGEMLSMESKFFSQVLDDETFILEDFSQRESKIRRGISELEKLLNETNDYQGKEYEDLKSLLLLKTNLISKGIEEYSQNQTGTKNEYLIEAFGTRLNEKIEAAKSAFFEQESINLANLIKEKRRLNKQFFNMNNISFFLGEVFLICALIYLLYAFRKQIMLQAHLVQTKEEVERVSRIKEQFLANMSHEIRTPLQTILSYSNFLSRDQLNPKQTQYVDNIKLAGENLLSIINDILDTSKISDEKLRFEKTTFSISDLITSIESIFVDQARNKNLDFKVVSKSQNPGLVEGDPVRLTQILNNLISNAIKFTNEGTIKLSWELKEKSAQEFLLGFSVEDTGIGIEKDKIGQIFERFEQADPNTTRKYGGSGLGLFIVKKLVEGQGGSITLSSTFGKGSRFEVYIPYSRTNALNLEQSLKLHDTREDLKGGIFSPDSQILIVEDNLMNQRIISMLLSDWNLEYDIAENGKVAINFLENKEYDLILMDMQMPELDGYETTEYIRQTLKNIEVPIIAMTAHAWVGEKEKVLSYGMDEYLLKPIKNNDLLKILKEYLPLEADDSLPLEQKESTRQKKQNEVPEEGLSIDLNFLLESSKGKKEHLIELLTIFIAEAPIAMELLEEALFNEDFEKIAKTAHSLKSTLGYAGMDHFFRPKLDVIETLAEEEKDTQFLKQKIAEINSSIQLAIKKVKEEIIPLINSGE